MVIVYSLLFLAAAFLIASYYVYRIAFYSRRKGFDDPFDIPGGEQYDLLKDEMLELIRSLASRECEDVYVTSFDGLRLHGRYYHIKDGAPLSIGFHGYRATALRDFCVGANKSFKRGHNILLIDERGQGKSEGRTITMGIKERRDVMSWVDYAVERFGKDIKIVLYGVSMGAATVVMSTSLDLPPNVKGVIADCPYCTPTDIVLEVAQRDMKIPEKVAYPFVWTAARLFGNFNINETNCADAVKKSKVPVIILHGEADYYVPCEMSKQIEDANKEKVRRYTFRNAGHGLSFFADRIRYKKLIEDFFSDCLK